MVYEGYLAFGSNEVVNSERVRGYAESGDCSIAWFDGDRCETLRDALGDDEYVSGNIPLAPWYDLSLPDVSGRFLGVLGLAIEGLQTSTRSSQTTEGIDDGGVIGRTRKGVRQIRVRATLIAQGRDALDYGTSWLSSSLDPGACGQHGTECGTTDMEYFTECPPERAVDPETGEPQSDEAYAAAVEPYRRFMHDVAATSGPLLVEIFESKLTPGVWGAIMEWTITSERPWIYSTTRAVDLPVTPTTVVQDTPYNLVPYPSAELADLVGTSPNKCLAVNATGWSSRPIATVQGSSPTAFWTTARSTVLTTGGCTASYRGLFQGVSTGSNVDGIARAGLQHQIDMTSVPTEEIVDLISSARFGPYTGEAADAHEMEGWAQWLTAADVAVGARIPMGSVTSEPALSTWQNFKATTVKPATATKIQIVTEYEFLWGSGPGLGVPSTIPVYMTAADAQVGYVEVGRNYSLNPSLETNATGWVGSTQLVSGSDAAPFFTSGRVVGELQAVGNASYRGRILGSGAAASGRARLVTSNAVNIATRPPGARVSLSIWSALLNVAGASVSTLVELSASVLWTDGVTGEVLDLGTVTDSDGFSGHVFSAKSFLPPEGATFAQVSVQAVVDWASGSTNSDIRLYADALAVTVP